MTDPISITGLLFTIGHTVSVLYTYGRNVKNAKTDIEELTNELLVLQGVLEQVKNRTSPAAVSLGKEKNSRYMLRSTKESLEFLLLKLETPSSKIGKAFRYAKWPLDKDEVLDHLKRFERLKSLLILVFLTEDSEVVIGAIQSMRIALDKKLERIGDLLLQQKDEELLRWLAPLSPEGEHGRISEKRQPGTRRWFFDGPFAEWLGDQASSALWLLGKSGTGKSTLFSFAVDALKEHCQNEPTSSLAFFYCRFTDLASQKAHNILGSMISQFARYDPTILNYVQKLYDVDGSSHKKPAELSKLEEILCVHLTQSSRTYILIDAPNECEDTSFLPELLVDKMRRFPNLYILIASTQSPPNIVQENFTSREVVLQTLVNKDDLTTLINHGIATKPGLRDLSKQLKQDIRTALISQADGSFRWVHLSLENLALQSTPKQVRRALEKLPPTLEDSYTDLLTNIPDWNMSLARQALLWLAFAKRPLRLDELNEAVIVQDNQTAIDEEDRLCHSGLIPEICRGLIDHHAGFVTLAHSSVATFLMTPGIFSSKAAYFALKPDEGDRVLMHMCLQYLSMDCFASGPCKTVDELAPRLQSYPLLVYATTCWAMHANSLELNQLDINSIMKFLHTHRLSTGGNYCSWIQILLPEIPLRDVMRLQDIHPLYYAASFGLAKIVSLILQNDKNIDINARGGRTGSTPLFVACWRGHLMSQEYCSMLVPILLYTIRASEWIYLISFILAIGPSALKQTLFCSTYLEGPAENLSLVLMILLASGRWSIHLKNTILQMTAIRLLTTLTFITNKPSRKMGACNSRGCLGRIDMDAGRRGDVYATQQGTSLIPNEALTLEMKRGKLRTIWKSL